jgi:hypothetical protein
MFVRSMLQLYLQTLNLLLCDGDLVFYCQQRCNHLLHLLLQQAAAVHAYVACVSLKTESIGWLPWPVICCIADNVQV